MLFVAAMLEVVVGSSNAKADNSSNNEQISNNLGTYSVQKSIDPKATVVTVGFYGVNAYEIDTSSNTFYYKGYMWLRWKGDADPVSTLEFANSVEE